MMISMIRVVLVAENIFVRRKFGFRVHSFSGKFVFPRKKWEKLSCLTKKIAWAILDFSRNPSMSQTFR